VFGAISLCLLGLRTGRTQSNVLRRVTNTTEEGINLNPSISGDGRILAFESTEDIAGAGGTDHFRAIRANIANDPATFFQMGATRAVAPAISQDGSRIAFASKDDPLRTNLDGNSEIFLLDGSRLTQVTNTSPGDLANRVTKGNFQPSISDDGRFIAFASNRDLAGQNSDGNLEIFVYDAVAAGFAQLTNTTGIVGSVDAKISGNGASIAFIRDTGTTPSARRDLMQQNRISPSTATQLSANVLSLAMTYGRAISDDGTRVVYSAETATNTTQVFLFDGRGGAAARQITTLGARVTEVPLHPTISGDGTRIAFAARRSVAGALTNSDGSVELYLLDIPSSQMSKITNAPSSATADVVSSLNDDGSVVAFNFPRVLSGAVANSELANDSEIYLTGTPARPPFGTLTVLNGASFGNEPSTAKAVAPDSIAVAIGGALANSTQQPQKLPNGTFPTNVGGTTVTVNGRAAQIFFVSPGQVNFLVPPQTEIGTAEVVIPNSENFTSRGTVSILRAAPGVFTKSGDGTGPGLILNSDTLQEGPFDPTSGNLRLTIFATGARNASQTSVSIGGRVVTPENVIASTDMPGLDEVHVLVPRDLRGAGTVDLFVQSDGRASNPVSITFLGDGTRDILINEVLADPPDQIAGDANRDGVRDSADDEFVELVNTTTHDIDISGYQLLSRSSSTTTDTLRHTFAAGTILPACSAAVVFGGGAFDPANAAFGGALVVKTTSGGLSLTNGGGAITLRDSATATITSFAWGGSTGLNGDANQSMTRSPDVTGTFVLHQAATDSGGRSYSPGTRVNGAPFAVCNPFVRIEVTPASAAIDAGAKQQFTAKAFNANSNEVSGVIFFWQSSNTSVATIDQNGLATSSTAGTTEIRASARGIQSSPATLTVREVQRVLTRIDVTPPSATIPAAGAQQFTAHGIDQFGNEMAGLTFTWDSTNTGAATVDQTGLASGVAQGQTTIRATSNSVTGTATLNVSAATVVINEVLADPPTGTEGDANHDGARDSADDEFVELVNSTDAAINMSGWTVRTHSTSSSTETVRHTFAANTNLPAGEALVVFGGGTINPANPLFGCAQIVKTSTAGLSLTNGGLTILVRDGSGNLVTQFSYGGTTGLNGGNAQSLTRSPDITGAFVLHSTPPAAGGRKFSPGVKLDGTPFGNCTQLTINDVTSNEGNSGTTTFTFTVSLSAPAPAGGVTFNIATEDNTATVANNDYVARSLANQTIPAGQTTYTFDVTVNGDTLIEPTESFFVNVTNVAGALVGDGQGIGTISNDDSPSLSINDVSASEGNAGTTTFTFTVTSTLPAPAGGISFDIATANGTATSASGDYVARALTGQTITQGQTTYTFDVTVNGDTLFEPNETFTVNLTNVSGASLTDGQGLGTILNDDSSNLVISQTYPGGGLAGATFTNDFIEIFNRGTATVDFAATSYSVQFLSTAGSSWAKTDLTSGTVAPGGYFLIKESGGATGSALPTGDATGTLNLTSTTAGKVALVLGTTLLTGNCPGDDGNTPFNPVNGAIADFVGYGGSANTANHCYEGSGPASFTLSNNTIADFRKAGGCTDTNQNTADFFVSTPSPRNTSSPLNNCTAGTPPSLTINDVTVTEGNSGTVTATFTVSLSAAAASTDVTFDIATQDNTALAGADYVARTLTNQIIPAGQTTYTFSVTVNGDITVEPDETFFVNLTNVSGATVTDGQGLGTITNDDLPTLSINDISANEGNGGTTIFSFTVNLSAPAPAAVTFDIATADNTATVANNDYVARSLTGQTIPAGQSSYTFDVTVNGDVNIEANETFFVNVTNVLGAAIGDGQGLGTIQNDDSPTISINDVTANEGNSGTTTFTFTVTSTLPAPTGGITFDIATQDNTATVANNDYVARTLTSQTIAATQTTYTFDVTVNGDLTVEPSESFFVNISNASGATLGDAQGAGTITNDDGSTLVISQTYPGGGLTGATFTNDFIELFNRGTTTVDFAATPYSVQFLSTSGSTWAKTDLTSGTVAPGRYFLIRESGGATGSALPTADATGTLNLTSTTAGKVALVLGTTLLSGNCPGDDGSSPLNPINGAISDFVGYGGTAATANHCYEGSGPASFTLSNNTIADFRKSGGCIDTNDNANDFVTAAPGPRNSSSPANDCSTGFRPDITINDVTVTEGDTGTKTVEFTVTLSAANATQTVTVDYTTADGTAAAGSDYQSSNGTVTFTAGQTSRPVTITINGDTTDEPNETFFVNLSNATNAAILDSQGQGSITDDDVPPTLTINDVSQNEGDGGTTTFTFTVSLSAPALTGGVTFDVATQDNTATVADNDYIAHSVTGVTIPAGQQAATFDVTVNGDVKIEPNEAFLVNVTNVTGAVVGDATGQGTIQNDDSPVLNINDMSVSEGPSATTTTLTFTVTSTLPAPASGITFDIATADNTATAGSDYVARTLTSQTIPAGQTTYPFDVTVNGDLLVEPNETFFVNLSNPSGATMGDGQGVGTISNDDIASLRISQVYGGGGNTGAIYKNDFIEIFNRGATTVDFSLTPYSIQYASVGTAASGNFGSEKTNLTAGVLAPGKYFLIQEQAGTGGTTNLPAPDAIGTIALAATTGKVALVSGTSALGVFTCPGDDLSSPFNPSDSSIADFVGYGSAATTAGHCYEGPGPAAAPSNTTADFRKAGGCTDTEQNAADFLVSGPFPRNTASPVNTCIAGAPPSLSINDVTVTEGNSGTTIATLTVSLSAPAPATDISFDIATANNSATTANSDYVSRTLTNQIIPAGQQTYSFDVTVNGDTAVEPDETFFVNLSNANGASILDGQGVGAITNDDLPILSINDVTLTEGNSLTKLFTFTVSLSSPAPAGGVTFDIATQDQTATVADSDYVSRSLTGETITPGNTTRTFDVTVNGDVNVEPDETFFVNVTNVTGATLVGGDSQGLGTIQNDDSPSLSINDVTVTEGNSGPTIATFTVTLSPASNQTVTVNYATSSASPATAVAGTDYVATSGTLTFLPNETSKTFDVTVNGDTTNEAICETYFVNLSTPTNATISDSQGQGGITDDDGTKLVISQVYGGGGNAGAQYTNDFIEIFNRGSVAVSLNGMSVQYSGATTTTGTFSVTALTNVTLQPGQYYLIQEDFTNTVSCANAPCGIALPSPNASGNIAMSATAGKVALVNGTTALSAVGCPSGATILDFVGYGTTANCREGSGTANNAPAPSNTTSDSRKLSGCQDTNVNSVDFVAGAPNPRNTSSTTSPCSCSTSYSSLLILGGESWKSTLARLSFTRLNPSP
jgi:hypothetical protein